MRLRPLDLDGPQRLVVSHANITERKLIELHVERLVEKRTHELAQQTARLEQALESEKELSNLQRQFGAMVSHEFRTPLAIIDASSQRLKRRKLEITPDEIEARSDKIRRSVQRMTTMIETVLYVARLDEHEIEFMPATCDLKATLTAACAE